MSKVTVIVARHGEKNKDALTAKGAMQIYGLALYLKEKYGTINEIQYSGAQRTHQCAIIAATAMGLWAWDSRIIDANAYFHFEVPFETVFKSQMEPYESELKVIKAAGGTMKEALEISEYTRVARNHITRAILDSAIMAIQRREKVFLAFSHGSYAEFAVPNHQLSDFPCMIPMGSAIAYAVEDGVITDAEYIPPVA
ncbi:MAG TPA: histidine phosphatase family protein [Candidatus Nanoarchaeia archaeon]|nr:histidine phosphatase family protein [Candidatus Nanoarchaeia archaeon]